MTKSLIRITVATLLFIILIWLAGSQPLFINPERVITPKVDSNILEKHVRHLSEVLPGRVGQEIALSPTVEWIEKQLSSYGKSYRQSYSYQDETFHNILIDFGPTLNDSNTELIIVGAHYDTAHGYAGADDNATGVAALIALARLLSENSEQLSTPIQLAFYTLEEPPYFRTDKMGSFVHATNLKEKQQKVKLMISLDMIGYFTDEENSQELLYPLMDKVYPTQGNFIAVISNVSNMLSARKVKAAFKSATDLPTYSLSAPAFVPGIDFSDHLNFWYYDYPAIMVTDTSFNRNKYYHSEQDTADKLDYVKMAEVVKALYQTVLKLSNE